MVHFDLRDIGFSLVVLGGLTAVIDPFFHYHAPLEGLAYPLTDPYERYQNDGIVRHFDYNAIITGTSMTANFKTTEFNAQFHMNAVKVPFSGASYKEINENLARAVTYNEDLLCILRCLDCNALLRDKDWSRYDTPPTYLYDDILWNDLSYILNKAILFSNTLPVLSRTKNGGSSTSFDAYSNWMPGRVFGKDAVAATYTHSSDVPTVPLQPYTESDEIILRENLQQNVISLIEANPQITFYLFFSPYSICYWDTLYQGGQIERQLTAEQKAIELLVPYENVKLFSFFDQFDLIVDLDNYKDTLHYGEDTNSQILRWIAAGEHQLTQDNYQAYCDRVWNFYTSYDYINLFT